jgi:hypothetical protein
MRQPAGKAHSKVFVREFTEAQKEAFWAKVDAIRQRKIPKKKPHRWLEPSTAEVMEEFA